MKSGHATTLHGLALVHAALRRSLETIVRVAQSPIAESDRAAFADFSQRTCDFVHLHHDGEEDVVFPTLKKAFEAAQLSDALAHLATWRKDHEKLLGKLAELEAATRAFAAGGPREPLAQAGAATRDLLLPHLDAEESVVDEGLLSRAMSGDEALAMGRAASKHGQKHGGPRILIHYLHGLSDEEQRSHFGAMPWFVRKLLVKRIWDRGYQPLVKFAHNRSIAL